MHKYMHHIADFGECLNQTQLPMVYVIATENLNLIKIGMTVNFRQRFTNIQSGCPYPITLWMGIKTPCPKKVEKYLHEKLLNFRTRGEWFKPDQDALDYIASFVDETNKDVRDILQNIHTGQKWGGNNALL